MDKAKFDEMFDEIVNVVIDGEIISFECLMRNLIKLDRFKDYVQMERMEKDLVINSTKPEGDDIR